MQGKLHRVPKCSGRAVFLPTDDMPETGAMLLLHQFRQMPVTEQEYFQKEIHHYSVSGIINDMEIISIMYNNENRDMVV